MTISHNLCQRLSSIGLKQELVHCLVDDIVKWQRSNGTEWVVQRLKEGKLYYLHQLAGKEYTPSIWQRRNRRGPTGSLGALLRLYGSQPSKCLNALNAASFFLAPSATAKQLKKFKESVVTREIPANSSYAIGQIRPKVSSGQAKLGSVKPWSEHSWSAEKRAPLSDGSTVPESDIERWLDDNAKTLVGFCLKASSPSLLLQAKIPLLGNYGAKPAVSRGGHIAFIQEPGFKLRAIANPYRLWQVLLDPLKQDLMDRLKSLDRDCTYDQSKGVARAQTWLREGAKVHSIDLSDATNRAPFESQKHLLASIYDMDDDQTVWQLRLFDAVSTTDWKLPDGTTIAWDRGQPLGLGPSFASFALWHNRILELCRKTTDGDYVVLGDDVCIKGDAMHDRYRQLLEHLRMPVSLSKCISSEKICEFAGKVITPDDVYTVGKWRQTSDRNFVDLARSLGPQSISMFRPRQREVLKVLGVIPEFLGGLGWNSKGLPFKDRLELAIEMGFLDHDTKWVPFRSSSAVHTQVLHRMAYVGTREISELDTTFERPTRTLLSRVNAQAGVTEGEIPLEHTDPDVYTLGNPVSDPRGLDQLRLLESKLRNHRQRLQCNDTPASIERQRPG